MADLAKDKFWAKMADFLFAVWGCYNDIFGLFLVFLVQSKGQEEE